MKQQSSALICFSFLLLLVCQKISGDESPNPKIVIIGAGPSGIAAATKLLEYGYKDFVILESESRIGGRVNSINFADNIIDLGAQWCHGEKNNVVYEMVKDLNLLETSSETFQNLTLNRSNGEQVLKELAATLQAIMTEAREKYNLGERSNMTIYDFLKMELNKALEEAENQKIDKTIADEYFLTFEKGVSSYEGADSSAEFLLSKESDYEQCEGDLELNWKDKGYKEFLKLLMKTKETGKEFGILQEHVRLSKKVKSINWQRDDLKALIECEDGEQIIADHVIVTVSLGVLKAQHKELFEPNLRADKQRAIEGINFGTINKILIEFKEKFWPVDWTGFSMLWLEQDLNEIRGTERAWLEGVFSFNVYNKYQPRVLEGWAIGPFGRHMETLSNEVVQNETLALFKRFLPWDLTEVANFTKTTWCTNPNFRGSYSYHSSKTDAAGVKPLDLELSLMGMEKNCIEDQLKSCKRPIVLFAGEATSTKHYSTVHGAVESGWREAQRLAQFYGVEQRS